MLLHTKMSAKTVISNVDEDMIQMHALDIRIATLYKGSGILMLKDKETIHRSTMEVPYEVTVDGLRMFCLEPQTAYTFNSLSSIEMAEGEAGYIIARSSLTRNNVVVGSALYDAGYKGGINGYIVNQGFQRAYIEVGARVGQFLILKAETAKLYNGQYQQKDK